jgi:hypothetical protein
MGTWELSKATSGLPKLARVLLVGRQRRKALTDAGLVRWLASTRNAGVQSKRCQKRYRENNKETLQRPPPYSRWTRTTRIERVEGAAPTRGVRGQSCRRIAGHVGGPPISDAMKGRGLRSPWDPGRWRLGLSTATPRGWETPMDRQYVGIDLHRRRSVIVRVDGDGTQLGSVRVPIHPRSAPRWPRRVRTPR